MSEGNEPWVGTREIAEHLGVHINTVRAWVEGRGMPHSRPGSGRFMRFRKSEVDAWMEEGAAEPVAR